MPRPKKLPDKEHKRFIRDVQKNVSDAELGKKYGLSERTATNWRLRLVGPR